MHNAAKIKQVLFALAIVLFTGQVFAQTAVHSEASRLITNEKYSDAITKLKAYLAEEPKDEKAEYLLGMAYMGLEKYSEAGAAFRSGAGHGTRYPMNHVGMGAVAVKNKDLTAAKKHMAKAVEVDRKSSSSTLLAIAQAYLGYPNTTQKNVKDMVPYLDEAQLYFQKVQLKEPDNAATYVGLGRIYDLQRIEESAEYQYGEAINRDPSYVYGYFRLGQLYKKQKKYNDAADKFRKCIEIDANFAPAYREMAEMWNLAGKPDKADENMTQYLKLMGDDLGAKMRSGTFKYLGERYDEAIAIMEPLLQDTNSLLLLRLLGYSYVKKENPDPDKALEYLDDYFSKAKEISYIASDYENRALAYELKGMMDEAIKEYETGMEMAEKQGEPNYEPLLNIANTYKANKDFAKQSEFLERYLSYQKRYRLKENFDLGLAHYRTENYEKSDSVFKVMTEQKPDVTIGWAWRAKSNAQMDPESKEGKALPYYEKVLEIIGEDAEKVAKYERDYLSANKYIAAYYTLVTEEFGKAIPHWEKILELKPEDESATNGLNYCKEKG
ncbi:MAG: tetratricopeptide repeat protein [Bacteroidota bacterium]